MGKCYFFGKFRLSTKLITPEAKNSNNFGSNNYEQNAAIRKIVLLMLESANLIKSNLLGD